MTREEAIKVLNMVEAHGLADKAKRIAIKALEQEPCDDAISRKAVIDAMFGLCDDGENPHIDAITDTIERIAPVTPKYTDAEIQKMQELEQAEIQKAYELGKVEQPQPKIGKWIVSDDKYFRICPFCNAEIDVSVGTGIYVDNDEVSHMNYCPNCGAKMQEVEE